MVTDHHENRDVMGTFALPLDGAFLRFEGEVAVNGYLIVQQEAQGTLRMHLNGRSDREMSLRLFMCDAAPRIEIAPEDTLQMTHYDEKTKCAMLTVSFAKGAVDIIVYGD